MVKIGFRIFFLPKIKIQNNQVYKSIKQKMKILNIFQQSINNYHGMARYSLRFI